MFHQGHCTMSQPGIPEQVIQHLNHIRLETLMAPRWSIILNEHGCQLQVYWRSPNNIEKDQVQCKTESDIGLPPAKKARKAQEINQIRTNGNPPSRAINIAQNGQLPRRNIVRPVQTVQTMTSAVPSLPNPNISGTYRPPTSPKFAKNTSPKISPQPLSINQVQPKPNMGQAAQYGLSQMDQISPKSIAISQQAASSAAAAVQAAVAANSQIAAAVQQQVKVAEVSIPIKRPPHQREPRKSIEATALMLMADRGETFQGDKMMSSPPEFITPPGSERSLSGEGKDTMTAETTSTEQTQKALQEFAMGDMYRQKFSCEICHKTFTRKYSLSRHYKEVHQGESRSSKFQSLGPSLLAIERTVNDPSRLLNDFGVPSLNRVPFANPNLSTDPDVKIEDLSQEEDDISPSMVLNRSNPTT